METENIEKFFLNTLLRISMIGVFGILLADVLLYPEDLLSIVLDVIVLSACIISYFIRKKYPVFAVIILTMIVLMAMIYQSLYVPTNTTTSLSIILVVGFIYSTMLKGRIMWIMHTLTFIALNAIFVLQFQNPKLRFSSSASELLSLMLTYDVLYFILTYASGALKSSYDKINKTLIRNNLELEEKAGEIISQNEELIQIQDNLNTLNLDLEKRVNERTAKIQIQNEILIKYSYTNAHHLRGPVARLLGLASIYKLEPQPDPDFIIEKMVDQAHEIDAVVKQINTDLESSNVDIKLDD